MAKNPLIIKKGSSDNFSTPENQSMGILDDYAVRKDMQTISGKVERTPTNNSDIANKKYVDDAISTIPSCLKIDQTTPQTITGGKPIFDEGIKSNTKNIFNTNTSYQSSPFQYLYPNKKRGFEVRDTRFQDTTEIYSDKLAGYFEGRYGLFIFDDWGNALRIGVDQWGAPGIFSVPSTSFDANQDLSSFDTNGSVSFLNGFTSASNSTAGYATFNYPAFQILNTDSMGVQSDGMPLFSIYDILGNGWNSCSPIAVYGGESGYEGMYIGGDPAGWGIGFDGYKMYFGGSSQSYLSFDGTDFVINPKNTGSGKLKVSGVVNAVTGYEVNGTAGINATITTAKLTAGGANGSMTFTKGILTAQTPAT